MRKKLNYPVYIFEHFRNVKEILFQYSNKHKIINTEQKRAMLTKEIESVNNKINLQYSLEV